MAQLADKKKFLLPVLIFLLGIGILFAVAVFLPKEGTPAAAPAPTPAPTQEPVQAQDGAVLRNTGEAYFPEEKNWVYHFTYAYPRVAGDSYGALMVNDTYQMALDEMLQLVLPMFANEESMRYDGKNEVNHDFEVKCNDGRFLSILQKKSQTQGEAGAFLSLEALTFDMSGEYIGESLTLRGVVMVGDSTDQIAEAVLPEIYEKFRELQQQGVCRQDVDREEFELEFSPAVHFYADGAGRAVFFLPPTLMAEKTFDVPLFPYTPEELAALL